MIFEDRSANPGRFSYPLTLVMSGDARRSGYTKAGHLSIFRKCGIIFSFNKDFMNQMRRIWGKMKGLAVLLPQRRFWAWSVVSLIVFNGVFFAVSPSTALEILGVILQIAGWPIYAIVYLLGELTGLMISLLVYIASYNNFIHEPFVSAGWSLVRDVANMFFIVIMLIIAFSTVVGLNNYSYKNLLFRTLLMAILVNFSKTITGLLIDFSQVFMLTFVHAFKDAAVGNFVTALGLDKVFQFYDNETLGQVKPLDVLISLLFSLIMTLVAFAAILVFVVMLVQRMVFLWFLAILSPLPWVLNILPFTKQQGGQWWSMFGKYLTTGPMIAFFLWLSLTSFQTTNSLVASRHPNEEAVVSQATAQDFNNDGKNPLAGGDIVPGAIGRFDFILSFIINIGMLVVAIGMVNKVGGMAGKFAGNVSKTLQNKAMQYSGIKSGQEIFKQLSTGSQRKREQKAQTRAAGILKGIGLTGGGMQKLGGKVGGYVGGKEFRGKSINDRLGASRIEDLKKGAEKDRRDAADSTDPGERSRLLRNAAWKDRQANLISAGRRTGAFVATGGLSEVARGMEAQKKKGEGMTMSLVADERKKLEGETDAKILSNINDSTVSATSRMASILEAGARKIVTQEDAAHYKNLIHSLGGGDQVERAFNRNIEKELPFEAARQVGTATIDDDSLIRLAKRIKDGQLDVSAIQHEAFGDPRLGARLAQMVGANANDGAMNKIYEDDQKRDAFRGAAGRHLESLGAIRPEDLEKGSERQKIIARYLSAGGSVETAFKAGDPSAEALRKAIVGTDAAGTRRNIGLNILNAEWKEPSGKKLMDEMMVNIQINDLQAMEKKSTTATQEANMRTIIKEIASRSATDARLTSLLNQIKSNPKLSGYV